MNDLYADLRKKQNHTDDLRNLIHLQGRLIGTSGPARFYVLDGKVYCDLSHTQLQYSGDYFDFCDQLRRGQLPGFRKADGFHLDNDDSKYAHGI